MNHEHIIQLSREQAQRLARFAERPSGGLRLDEQITVEAVEGGGLLVRTCKAEAWWTLYDRQIARRERERLIDLIMHAPLPTGVAYAPRIKGWFVEGITFAADTMRRSGA